MKNRLIVLSIISILTIFPLSAQNIGGTTQPIDATQLRPTEMRHTLSFESRHGETFTVFIDGRPVNRMPQTRVMAADVSSHEHEVVVVMKRPTERVAVLNIRPTERNVNVGVNYDSQQESLVLYTNAANRGRNRNDYDVSQLPVDGHPHNHTHNNPPHQAMREHEAEASQSEVSDDRLAMMILDMRAKSFSDDRLALGKTLVAATPMRADQIAQLVATLDFSAAQIEFLKYAYDYCTDPQNYQVAINKLTFSADQRKVQNYIATR